MDWCSSCDTYACHGKDPCHRDGRSHMWDMSYPPKVDMCIYVCAPPLLNDRLARVWRALIGAPFRIKVMDTCARVQMQVLYPWDPLVCSVADMVTRARHLLIFEGTRSGSGYVQISSYSTCTRTHDLTDALGAGGPSHMTVPRAPSPSMLTTMHSNQSCTDHSHPSARSAAPPCPLALATRRGTARACAASAWHGTHSV